MHHRRQCTGLGMRRAPQAIVYRFGNKACTTGGQCIGLRMRHAPQATVYIGLPPQNKPTAQVQCGRFSFCVEKSPLCYIKGTQKKTTEAFKHKAKPGEEEEVLSRVGEAVTI